MALINPKDRQTASINNLFPLHNGKAFDSIDLSRPGICAKNKAR
jgi:hypothetical protein